MLEHSSNFLELDTLIQRLRDEKNRWDAILELKLSENVLWAPRLIEYLSDPDWIVRWCVAEKLGDLKDLESVKPLIKALSDSDEHVVKNAFYALKKFGAEIVPVLVDFYGFPNSNIRSKIHELLLEMGEPIVPILRKELDKYMWVVGNRIVHLIWEISKHNAEDVLISCLNHKYAQKSAIIYLGGLKSVPSIPHLIRMYQNPSLRRTIFYALRLIGKEASFPIIIHSLSNSALATQAEDMILKVGSPMLPYLTKEQARPTQSNKEMLNVLIKKINAAMKLK